MGKPGKPPSSGLPCAQIILSAKLPPLLVSVWSKIYLCPLLKLLHSLDAYLPQIAAKS
jgi:hypothetical protein